MRKKKLLSALFTALCLLLVFTSTDKVQAKVKKNYEWMDINAKLQSFTKVKLSWPKKKNIQKVVIYGGTPDRSGNLRYSHKVKTLAGSRTSVTFTTKKKKKYGWRVEAVQKVKNNKQNIYCGEAWVYTDIDSVVFDDYQYHEGKTTPNSIRLMFYPCDEGITPDGFEIARRPADGGSWKVVKSIKGRKTTSFTDKTVSEGSAYEYRVRGWKKIGRKKYFGPGYNVVMYAVNWAPKLQFYTTASSDEEMSCQIESDSGNGVITLRVNDLVNSRWLDQEAGIVYRISEYSEDGLDWQSPEDTDDLLTLAPDSSIWFRMEKSPIPDDADEDDYFDDFADPYWSIPANYHGQHVWYMVLNLPNESVSLDQDSEAVH